MGNSRTLATKNVEFQGNDYYSLFVSTSKGEMTGSSDRVRIPPSACEGDAHCRSRSSTLSKKGRQPMEDIDNFIGKRVAKYFGNIVFFGSVIEIIRGAAFVKQRNTGIRVLQVV
jgi:hypothetical protein